MSANQGSSQHMTQTPGSSWVYLFSQFTTEALLFEGLLISLLCAGYAAFWILRKRRLGVIEQAVPAGVVRTYLNALILDAEQLRAQLFGLLASHGIQLQPGSGAAGFTAQFMAGAQPPQGTASTGAHPSAGVNPSDPELLKKFSELELKIAEQSKSMDSITSDKQRLEKELAEARAKSAAGGGGGADVSALNEQIKQLQARLAEYSVIEDDLANLKRLQQENAQLKAALSGAGGSVAAATAAPPAPEPAPEPTAEASQTAPTPEPESEPQPEPLLAAEMPASAPETTEVPQFENLVDQVEQSLQETPPQTPTESPAPAAETLLAEAPLAAEAAPTTANDKSNDDLVAEFEKMLNS